MKRYLLMLALLAACTPKATPPAAPPSPEPRTAPAPPPPPSAANQLTGALSARLAVDRFLTAVRSEDIQAMSVIFGTTRGSARDNIDRSELEKRLIILQCYFNHDKFRILADVLGEGGHRVVTVELTRRGVTRHPRFYAIRGPRERWYVDNMEIAVVRDFCRN